MDATTLVALISSVPVVGQYAVWLPVLIVVCSLLDAALPQPVAGSAWVTPRRIVSIIGLSVLNARNAIPAGSRAAAVVGVAEAVEVAVKPVTPAGNTP